MKDTGLFLLLVGILVYRSLDYWALTLKLEQTLVRTAKVVGGSGSQGFATCRALLDGGRTPAELRKMLRWRWVGQQAYELAPYGFMAMILLVLFIVSSAEQTSIAAAVLVLSVMISGVGCCLEYFRLELERA